MVKFAVPFGGVALSYKIFGRFKGDLGCLIRTFGALWVTRDVLCGTFCALWGFSVALRVKLRIYMNQRFILNIIDVANVSNRRAHEI